MALVALEGTDQLRVMARCQPCGRLVSHSPPAPPLFCPSTAPRCVATPPGSLPLVGTVKQVAWTLRAVKILLLNG